MLSCGTPTPHMLRRILCALALAVPVASASQPATLRDLDPDKALTQYVADAWGNEDGLPQSRVEAVTRSRSGHLWFGTQEGLARFDGVTFTAVPRGEGGLPNADIRSLAAHPSGGVWVGTRRAGLLHVDRDLRVRSVAPPDRLPHPAVGALAVQPDGTLWIGTFDGLCRLREGGLACFGTEDGLPHAYVRALVADARGVWVGTRGGLARVERGEIRSLAGLGGAAAEPIGALAADAEGGLWIGPLSAHPLGYLRDGRLRRRAEAPAGQGLETEAMVVDRLGTLWVGTFGGGLLRVRGERVDAVQSLGGADLGTVLDLFLDPEGSLWIGTGGGGLARLRDAPFTPITTAEGLPDNRAYTVAADPAGGVWVGTTGGLAKVENGRATRTLTAADGLLGNDVSTVLATRDGTVWAGIEGEGICRVVSGRVAGCLTPARGLPDPFVLSLHEDATGALWAGTSTGLARWTGAAFEPTTDLAAPVTALGSGGGVLWVGTYGAGLLRVRGGTAEPVPGTEDDNILSVHATRQRVWAGTDGGGLLIVQPDSPTGPREGGPLLRLTTANGLPSDIVPQVMADASGALWISSNRGVARAEPAALAAAARRSERAEMRLFGLADGLPSAEANGGSQPAGAVAVDGTVYVPTNGGVAAVRPAAIRRNALVPPVAVERLVVNGEPVSLGAREVAIGPGAREIEIDYAGLSTFAPDRVQHRFMLVGRDEGWTEAGTRRSAFYTDLAPGTYVFRVQASNGDGVWSEAPATVPFRVRPFFWQTGWFLALCALALAGAAFGAYRVRTARLRARAAELERLVDARTAELAAEKAQVERLNGELAGLNATLQDKVREQLAEIVRGSRLRKYFPRKVVDRILNQEGDVAVEAERRPVTVVFTDLAGFTRLSEATPPDEVTALLNEYLNAMVQLIDEHGGTLDKFMGDGIMVLFGAADPMATEEQARRALAMTAAMQREMARLREAWAARGMRRDLDLRIGVHHAEVTVGNFGSDELVEFTAIGRGVNLAARLESACAPGGVLVSSEVRALAPDAPFDAARQLELKGIEGTVQAFPLRLAAGAERVGEA